MCLCTHTHTCDLLILSKMIFFFSLSNVEKPVPVMELCYIVCGLVWGGVSWMTAGSGTRPFHFIPFPYLYFWTENHLCIQWFERVRKSISMFKVLFLLFFHPVMPRNLIIGPISSLVTLKFISLAIVTKC